MKKGIWLLVLLVTFLLPMATAAINETAEKQVTGKAYVWLNSQVRDNLKTVSADELALSIVAMPNDDFIISEGKQELLARSMNSQCWPSPTCRIKTTALAMLALNRLGENTDSIEEWLNARKASYTPTGVTWLLQIDSSEDANCTIEYDSKSYKLGITKTKKYSFSGASPTCLSITNGNYWLEISKSCLDKSFYVDCNQPAIVSMPYKLGTTMYIPSESSPAPAHISIITKCLKEGVSCNYDATQWAAYALQTSEKDYAELMPYLVDQAAENKNIMSDAFLYLLTTKTENAENLIQSQGKDGFWADTGGFGKYYDTSLAYLAIKDYALSNSTKAKEALLKENVNGSWGTSSKIRDTSMILSFVWPSTTAILPSNDCQNVYGYSCRTSCLDTEERDTELGASCQSGICCMPKGGGNCKTTADCKLLICRGKTVTDANGNLGTCEYPSELTCDDKFDNDGDGKTDDDDTDCTDTCAMKGGEICSRQEICSVTVEKSYDTYDCCMGECQPETQTCSEQNFVECSSSQDCKDSRWAFATDTNYCCETSCVSKSSILLYIIAAVVLVLGALAFYLYKKGFFRKKPEIKKPIFPSEAMSYRPPVRPLIQQPQTQIIHQPQPVNVQVRLQPKYIPPQERRTAIRGEVKSELDETLKKLKKLAEEKK